MILWELVPWFSRCGLCMRRQLPTWLLAPVLDVALLIQLPVNDLGKQQKNMQVFGPLRSHGRPSISSRLQIDSAPTVEAIWQVNQPVVGRSLCLSLFLSNLQFRIENKIWNYEIVERKYGKAKMFMLALLFFFFLDIPPYDQATKAMERMREIFSNYVSEKRIGIQNIYQALKKL